MSIELTALQQQRRDTAANWTGADPTLLNGELGYETDTGKFKIGDGSTAWTSLSYLPIPDVNGLIPINQLLLPAGTAAAPSLTFTGDVDTGVYSVGANSFGIATAGSAALTIDSSQQVGIGTASPTAKLQIESTSDQLKLTYPSIASYIHEVHSNGDYSVAKDSSERMRIDSSGTLGVGCTPNSFQSGFNAVQIGGNLVLNVDSTGAGAGVYMSNNVYRDSGNSRWEYINTDEATQYLQFDGQHAWRYAASGSANTAITWLEAMRIDSSGRVAIGTDSPPSSAQLTIRATNAEISAYSSAGGTSKLSLGDTNDHDDGFISYVNGSGNKYMRFDTNADERMRLDSSGRLSLGATSSTVLSTFALDSSNAYSSTGNISNDNVGLKLFNTNGSDGTGANNYTGIQFNVASGATSSGSLAYVRTADNQGAFVFNQRTGASSYAEAMRIDSSGQVMIGVSSSSYNFTVAGTSYRGALIGSTNGNTAALLLDGASNGDGLGGDYGSVTHLNTGELEINNRQANSITFKNTSSSTERMRLDGSGRLIVGRTSSVTSGSAADSIVQIVGKSGVPTDLGQLTIARGNSASNLTSGAEIGEIIFSDNTGGNFAQIQCSTDGTPGTNDYPGRLAFFTSADGASSPTERMRIDNRGRFFTYNSNTGNNSLTVGSAAAAGTSVAHYIGAYGATAVNTGTASFIVWTNGDVVNTNNSYGSISDAKLKENIVDANSQWNDLKAIQIRNYNFIEGQTHTQIGVVAQEVETVSPGLVSESPDRDEDGNDLGTVTKSVNYSVLYMKAVKALQEAMERIEALEQRLTDAGL